MLPVEKNTVRSIRMLGAEAAVRAMESSGIDRPEAFYLSNLMADELQNQKHTAALIADQAGFREIEAIEVRAATASGAAAFHTAVLAIASGYFDVVMAVGVEKMSEGNATPVLAKNLDAVREVPSGGTMVSMNAKIMEFYLARFGVEYKRFSGFAVNAHANAAKNPLALFQSEITGEDVANARMIHSPIRLFDCAPVCDGAAAVVLVSEKYAVRNKSVRISASAVATDRFAVKDREDPVDLAASRISAKQAYSQANLGPEDISFFELHDAFSIMSCLALEACGFASRGEGWKLASSGEIFPGGRIPISTMGGLKGRGHPIGATALYQAGEIFLQLTEKAGPNQIDGAKRALTQSIGGAGTTILTHILEKY